MLLLYRKACLLMELNEETGLDEKDINSLSLRYITLRRAKDEIRQNYYFFAYLNDDTDDNIKSAEGKTKWFSFPELSELDMPFTSRFVLKHFLEEGKETEEVYGGVADGEKVVFIKMPEF